MRFILGLFIVIRILFIWNRSQNELMKSLLTRSAHTGSSGPQANFAST